MSILDGVKLLGTLSDSQKKELEMFCQPKFLTAGEVLFKEYDDATAMYFLTDGVIEVFRNIDGNEISLGEVHAEEILGEMAVFGDSSKRMATAKAITDCNLIVVLSFSIKQMVEQNPELLEKIKEIINYRIIENKNIK